MSDRWATFDCYGTLIDWERGIAATFARLWPAADPAALLARYHAVEPMVQEGSGASYRAVLCECLRRLAEAEGLPLLAADEDALPRSLSDWPPFEEVPVALSEVRSRGWRLAILSNTDPDLLDASIRNLGVDIEERVTVAEAGSYKPALGHWERFFERTAADRAHHMHVAASLFHDIAPAEALGLRSVWIDRAGEATTLRPTARLDDLSRLPDTLDRLVPPLG
jgi:2-haloacid dehalogenase